MATHVEVALPLPLFTLFTYSVEGRAPGPGTRVVVPFRNRERVGWVIGPAEPRGLKGIRSILEVLEVEPSVPSDLLELARWISEYYATPLGLTLRSMTPSVLSDGSREVIRLTPRGEGCLRGSGDASLPPRALRVLEAVAQRAGDAGVRAVQRELGVRSIWTEIHQLTGRGLLLHETLPPPPPPILSRKVARQIDELPDLALREERFARARRQRECFELLERSGGVRELAVLTGNDGFSRSVISGLEAKGLVVVEDEEVLRDPFLGTESPEPDDHPANADQSAAIRDLIGALDEDAPTPRLLHGVTGSGKTLVYIRLLQEVVDRRGRTAIVLVPEIALTPQTVSRFRAWFGDRVAVLHSGLSDGERFDQWRQLRAGEKRIVVGARSALFAPLPDLGVIVVDEEHESSYKQSDAPRYHARDVAVLRASLRGALSVLGSATPALESWMNAESGKFRRLSLPRRAAGNPLPPVEVVDLRKLRTATRDPREGGGVLSPPLVEAVRGAISRKEQAILLLNRRGYASFLQCRACGEVVECPSCSVSLTFHRARGILLCHHCRHEEPAPSRCPRCGDPDLSYRGMGTEQVERVVGETFPEVRIARMDVDTTSGKWSHAEILGRVGRGEVDILLGTQMIAKGLDFPSVTVVGVVNADVGLHLPDFRASERTFQLLSQVAGRAGRGTKAGVVFIQTSLPGHYSIESALSHDYVGFARREVEERRSPSYPPHLRLVNVIVSSPSPGLAADAAEGAANWFRMHLRGRAAAELIGPAPSPIERLHGRWRWHFFLKGGRVAEVTALLRAFLEENPLPPGDVRAAVDRDPVALL